MKIVVAYIAVTGGPVTEDYCARFVTTYHEYPPGAEHETLVIANGGLLPTSTALLFETMGARMFPRSNEGWDIGAYIAAARGPCADADMMLCCGESVYFHRSGWLARCVDAWKKSGPGMYGPFASNMVRPHLNTTAFFVSPILLQQYPRNGGADRYGFEHGENAFWHWVAMRGFPVKLVTWDGEWEPRMWRSPSDILWRGNQRNCLLWCNHTDRYVASAPALKARWAQNADRPFR